MYMHMYVSLTFDAMPWSFLGMFMIDFHEFLNIWI